MTEQKKQENNEQKPKYTGFIAAPKTYSTLAGGMVSTGVDKYQCPRCGYWMDNKMSPSEEKDHLRQCR